MYSRMRYPLSCFCLVVLATFGFFLAGSSSKNIAEGASGPISGIGLVRLSGSNWGSLTNTDKYGVILASAGNATYAGAQPARALMYACGDNTFASTASASCGVSYTDAEANGWVLKDSTGADAHYRGDLSIVLLDIGNAAYQQRFVSDIDADLRTHPGIDGLFIDDLTGSSLGANTKYPDAASYRAAMLSFIAAVGPALRAKGWYVAVNASIYDPNIESTTGPSWDGSQFIWWVKQIASSVDGIYEEHWQENWDSYT